MSRTIVPKGTITDLTVLCLFSYCVYCHILNQNSTPDGSYPHLRMKSVCAVQIWLLLTPEQKQDVADMPHIQAPGASSELVINLGTYAFSYIMRHKNVLTNVHRTIVHKFHEFYYLIILKITFQDICLGTAN